jgi:ATP-dependent Clp protease ATP-binding subunit ClpB
MEVPLASLKSALEQALERRPRVSGPGVEAGKIYVTQRLQKLFVQAEDEAKRLKDEYVSVEHITLALITKGRLLWRDGCCSSFASPAIVSWQR